MPDSASRQSFLGQGLVDALDNARIGVIGLSGGGSHIVQQLAHIGFSHYYLFDPDVLEDSNLTRVVGATAEDAALNRPKVEIARRLISSVQPNATIHGFAAKWQERLDMIKCADLIFGCVDSFATRRDLEILTRRNRIPFIDIGMDVLQQSEGARMFGQAVLSLPGGPCLFCQKVLTEALLAREASAYGAAGPRPQVVWANGVLASSAIGIAIDLLTGWSGANGTRTFLSYDGNLGTVAADPRLIYCPPACEHFAQDDLGDPRSRAT